MDLAVRLKIFADKNDLTLRERMVAIERMRMIEESTGLVLCPCSYLPPDVTTEDLLDYTRCPCPDVLRQISNYGSCGCGLFTVA